MTDCVHFINLLWDAYLGPGFAVVRNRSYWLLQGKKLDGSIFHGYCNRL